MLIRSHLSIPRRDEAARTTTLNDVVAIGTTAVEGISAADDATVASGGAEAIALDAEDELRRRVEGSAQRGANGTRCVFFYLPLYFTRIMLTI